MSQKQKKPVEVVVFNNPGRKKSDEPASGKSFPHAKSKSKSKKVDDEIPTFEYDKNKAKYDVRKLAIHSMKKTEKADAMVDLLVELGAKRPKNKCLHPKDYMEQLKRKREEEIEEDLRNGTTKKKKQRKRKRDKDDLLSFVDGQKGWYKDGVQFVSK